MGRIKLTPRRAFDVLTEAERITPDAFSGKDLAEIGGIAAHEGRLTCTLRDLFEIEGGPGSNADDTEILIDGDVNKVCRIGERMTSGKIVINGSVGHYLGRWMAGGEIEVKGSARSWLGAEMLNGTIEVFGDAGDFVGGRLRGKMGKKGMKKGLIRIHGRAGAQVGYGMVKGNIIVDASCGPLAGAEMLSGKILIRGDCGGKAGANMSGGSVIIGGKAGGLLPGFYIDSVAPSAKAKGEKIEGPFYVFTGDVLANPKCGGRLFISAAANPELKSVAELLG